jgi:FAD/FMN-containing dehydrogenase
MKQRVCEVRSFGRCDRGTSLVCFPKSAQDILEVFARATSQKGRRVAIRGGGHSFDSQAVHHGDDGSHIILSGECLHPNLIEFDPQGKKDRVRLGAGVTWGKLAQVALERAKRRGEPIRLPGSIQTGRKTTIGGSLAGNTLSRFSGVVGKESQWIESFHLVTPRGDCIDVSRESHLDLFRAVVGGHGYLGMITDATYRLAPIDARSVAHTTITRHRSFRSLIEKQLRLIAEAGKRPTVPTGVSSAWYHNPASRPPFKGAVFKSHYAPPSGQRRMGFPLYNEIEAPERYWVELAARDPRLNLGIHEFLFFIAGMNGGRFQNTLLDFLFFMDGNTVAKEKFERRHKPKQFQIVQQTYVVDAGRTEEFARACETEMQRRGIQPTECDMLYVKRDDALMSANYQLDGFAVTLGFEPVDPNGCPPPEIPRLLRHLSERCLEANGRIHLVKNVHADPGVLREMFLPQIEQFEAIKRHYDPDLILQNTFSDKLFEFSRRDQRRR